MAGLSSTMFAMLPDPNPRLLTVTAVSCVVLAAYYNTIHQVHNALGKDQTERQKCWVLTLFSSAIMTLSSLPYLWYWLKTGQVDILHGLAEHCSCFFIAYLAMDLVIGSLHYRSSISLLTGWVHHITYILLLSLVIIPQSYAPLFALCCILELPTFLLAAGSLDARLRNDYLFAAVFFATRIVLHIFITAQHALLALSPARGSWTPVLILSAVLPMHLLWMHACISGILRRRRRRRRQRRQQQPQQHVQEQREHTRLLSRPLISSVLAHVRARHVASGVLLRRSRQHVLRLLHDALREAAAAAQHPHQEPLVRWRAIQRRVADRLRRSLAEYEGGVTAASSIDTMRDAVAAQ
ncbi:hypothetical protein PHLGIDRAFT_381856 [Phlebiopsis gigantea 11061_1 CR5-6]|uniref:TLC domain-containing protein n=1 Tax=Phlebiopsis gigantea (strain 11061_1 CR5-6) TaxID=745531 RepID=A0A0C3P941_PHLG1|nr:hypothetical protein PHLGIDRAFT_381856 [Phlebiopsis gigantea 11061_1 CR5-6]